jgi:hypothetical protein
VVQPRVPKNDAWVPKVSDEERLDPFLFPLLNMQFDVPLNNSSLVFRPIHIVNFLWAWEERCLDFEGFGKPPVDEVFSSPTINESFLFSCSM